MASQRLHCGGREKGGGGEFGFEFGCCRFALKRFPNDFIA